MLKKRTRQPARFSRVFTVLLCLCMAFSLFTPLKANAAEGDVAISKVKPTPMVRADGTQEAKASIVNNGAGFTGWAKVTVGSMPAYMTPIGTIATGASEVVVPVTDTNAMLQPGETTNMRLELYDNELGDGPTKAVYENSRWERTRHWEFYLTQQMHTDLGYTDYQENLKKSFSGYLDMAKQYIANSDNRGTDLEKYNYSIESAFMMGESYMKNRSAGQIEELVDLIQSGRMIIGAGQFNYTPENFSTEGAARATYYTNRHLVDMLGIDPTTTENFFDNPSISKGYVDMAVKAGIKYGLHSMNFARSPYYKVRQFDLYYMQGMDPNNKLLIFNGKKYTEDYGLGVDVDKAYTTIMNLISDLENRSGRGANPAFPYDKFAMALVPAGDNRPPDEKHIITANELNAKWHEDGKYIYPTIKTAFPQQFFEDVEQEYGHLIPTETGTEENWWNDGLGTTAYESGIAKEGEKLIPVAETTASIASALQGTAYPYEDLTEAVERSMLYNEHTWGASSYNGSSNYHDQFEWKRSNAFGARALADKVLTDSLQQLSSRVRTEGQGIYVYNPLNWVRDDVVTITDLPALPEYFVIKDGAVSVPYTVEDGALTFVANDVPALGYKTFEVEAVASAPTFTLQVLTGDHYIENNYYKVTFAEDGTIASIVDKQNGNREIVDGQAPVRFNQYQYYDDFGIPNSNEGVDFTPDKWKLYTPKAEAGKIDIQANGYSAVASLNTSTFRSSNIRQHVTLYNDIPRIDIRNEVVKESVPTLQSKEEAFYTFPFLTSGSNYEIRYDLPVGNTTEGEQVYGTSTDWYTANKWVNVKDKTDDYNMTLAIPNTSLLQFGERRTGNWSFDYQSEKPYIYSYVMNNIWHTNFQGDQPGEVDFKYSIYTNQDAEVGESARFGWETSTPLQATVITGAQDAAGNLSGNLIQVNNENVQLTTMKSAEANSDGMIVRFHEMTGHAASNVTVTLPFAGVSSVTETDIIENDLAQVSNSGTFSFDLPAYGIRTFRIRFGAAPAAVTNLTAVSTIGSTQTNLSLTADVTASSTFNSSYPAENARSIDNGLEWASKGEKTAWLQYDWEDPVTVKSIHIADRPNLNDNVVSATIIFDDGSTFDEIGNLPTDGKKQVYVLPEPQTTKSLKIEIVGGSSTSNIGLLGLEAHSTDVVPTFTTEGTQLHWDAVGGSLYYEIFRSKDPDFVAGSGNYVGTTNNTVWFDTQVTGNAEQPYYYRVRAAGAGAKGATSIAATPAAANIVDTTPPAQPILGADVRSKSRIDLFWTPVTDDVRVQNYVVYRDGVKLGGLNDNHVTTYRDRTAEPGMTYTYTVEAVDTSGNAAASNAVTVKTANISTGLSGLEVSGGVLSPKFDSETTYYSLKVGDNFRRLEGIRVTPSLSAADPDAVITVNGVEVASDVESEPVPIRAEGDTIVIRVDKDGATRIYEIAASGKPPIIPAVSATAGSEYNASKAAANLINNSGMSGNDSLQDTHKVDGSANDMWHTANNPGANAWVEVDLGKVYPLDEMWIWNLNQSGAAVNITRGLKNVKIEYSTDELNWQALSPPDDLIFKEATDPNYPFQLKQGTALDAMKATNLNDEQSTPVRFDGKEARYVRITAHPTKGIGSWGDSYFGLAELRFTSLLELAELVPVESITISADNAADEISVYGGSLQLSAKVEPSDATYQDVIWSVTDEDGNATNSAVITETGKLIASRNGVVQVVAAAVDNPGISDRYVVRITGQKQLLTVASASAGSTYASSKPAENLINGSGMSTMGTVFDVHDNHGSANTMWHTAAYPGENAWVEFDFGAVRDIGEMWIWNLNQSSYANRGLKDVKIEYKAKQEDAWIELKGPGSASGKDYPYTLAKASGKPDQAATNLDNGQPVIFHKQAQFVRITADPVVGQGTYGEEYYGLSEVRFIQDDEAVSVGTITGTVTDSVYGVEGASVNVMVDGTGYQATTAADGTYTIADVPAGTGYEVTVTKAGYIGASATDVVVEANETTIVDLMLTAIPPVEGTGIISGTVSDSVYGIEGASVSVIVNGTGYQATTAADGTYSIVDVPAGTGYVVTASKAGYTSASVADVTVTENEVTAVNLVLLEEVEPGIETYALSVSAGTGGRITAGASGKYEAGQVIAIAAQAYSDYRFNRWVSTGGGAFAHANSASTTFTMPANEAMIMATFTYVGSDDGDDDDDTPTPTPTPTPKPDEEKEPTKPAEPTQPVKPIEPETPTVVLSDVAEHWAKASIEKAVALGFVNGYEDGTFRADRKVTRGEFSTMLARALKLELDDSEFRFADRDQTPAWVQPFIQAIAKAGFVSGYEDGSFRTNNEITRMELVVMIVRALGLEVNPSAAVEFGDTDQIPAWAKPYIAAAAGAGLIKGNGDGKFYPNTSATRAEAVTLVLAMMNYVK